MNQTQTQTKSCGDYSEFLATKRIVAPPAGFTVEHGNLHCALQLDVVERACQLWTNPGDLVATPFGGIGTEVYVAVSMGRRGLGCELKERYWQVGLDNIRSASDQNGQTSLLDLMEAA